LWTSTCAGRRRWWTRSANTWPTRGIEPASFYYEKFAGSGVVSEIGEIHVKVPESNEAFDARMALEAGAAAIVCGTLSPDQLAEYRRLADATGMHINDGQFTDAGGFREANAAFHLFPVQATGNQTLIQAHRRLQVCEYMGQVLSPTVELVGDITQDHRDIVDAFDSGDLARLLAVMAEHNEHAKSTMRAGTHRGTTHPTGRPRTPPMGCAVF